MLHPRPHLVRPHWAHLAIILLLFSVMVSAPVSVAAGSLAWSIASSPNPTLSTTNSFNGDYCVSTTDCWAVGRGNNDTLTEQWNGTVWTIITSPNAAAFGGYTVASNYLIGVSCSGASFCMAVGYTTFTGTDPPSFTQALAEEWNGTSWSIVTTPDCNSTPDEASLQDGVCNATEAGIVYTYAYNNNYLQSVSCVSSTFCLAVGSYCTSTATADNTNTHSGQCVLGTTLPGTSDAQTFAEKWSAGAWSLQLPPDTSLNDTAGNQTDTSTTSGPENQEDYLESVSCLSTTDCYADGYYYKAGGGTPATLADQWSGSAWVGATPAAMTTANSADTDNWLFGITCVAGASPDDCWGVGAEDNAGNPNDTLIENWNGTSWSLVASFSVAGQTSQLNTVTCASSTDCFAAQLYVDTDSENQPLIEQWNGTTWSQSTAPTPSLEDYSVLFDISCTSTSFCMVVGDYCNTGTAGVGDCAGTTDDSTYQAFIEEWNGSAWSVNTTPNVAVTMANALSGVSCFSATFCMAVGSSSEASNDYNLIEEWNGTLWSALPTPNSTTSPNYLDSVSCTSTTFCMAVGDYCLSSCGTGSEVDQNLAMTWNGTDWTLELPTDVSTSDTESLSAVTCISTTDDCWAVGSYDNGTDSQAVTQYWNASSWTTETAYNTATAYFLYGVSCVSSTNCFAVGFTDSGTEQNLIEQWTGGPDWTLVSSPDIGSGNNLMSQVSCLPAPASFCMADGNETDSDSVFQTVELEWTGTTWSSITSPSTSASAENYLFSISCESTTLCMADGFSTGSINVTLDEEWNGTSWAILTTPNGDSTTYDYLQGVSCATSTYCASVGYYDNGTIDVTLIEQTTYECNDGSLTLVAPSSITFPGLSLDGANETVDEPVSFTPNDETGTGDGWQLDATSTLFTTGSDTLPANATTVASVGTVTGQSGFCSLPTNTLSYPITIPAGATPPAAAAIYTANTSSGEGPTSITLNCAITVPADAFAGDYTSTWTVTLSSGP